MSWWIWSFRPKPISPVCLCHCAHFIYQTKEPLIKTKVEDKVKWEIIRPMNFSRSLIYFVFRQTIQQHIAHASNVFLCYEILLKRPMKTGIKWYITLAVFAFATNYYNASKTSRGVKIWKWHQYCALRHLEFYFCILMGFIHKNGYNELSTNTKVYNFWIGKWVKHLDWMFLFDMNFDKLYKNISFFFFFFAISDALQHLGNI